MKTTRAYCIDIDNTITEPLYDDQDAQACVQSYVQAGIVTPEETAHIQYHPQLYSLPQVAVTHRPLPNVVEALQHLVAQGASLQYVTLRNSFDPQTCAQIHENTHVWLKDHHFPCPMNVRFVWNLAEKLDEALAASEQQVVLIDDRPAQLLQAYQKLAKSAPHLAREIRERVILAGFWLAERDLASLPIVPQAPKVLPLATWSQFDHLMRQIEQDFSRSDEHTCSHTPSE